MADEVVYQRVVSTDPVLANDPALRRRLAPYLISAVPGFFARFPLEEDKLLDAVGEQIGMAGTEYEGSEIAWLGDTAVGLMCWCPLEKMEKAQQAGTIRLMRHVDRAKVGPFLASLADYGKDVEPIPEGAKGLYATRLGVGPEARGRGVGATLMRKMIEAAEGGDVWQHVVHDFADAIRIHRKLGFEFISDKPYAMRAMVRRADA